MKTPAILLAVMLGFGSAALTHAQSASGERPQRERRAAPTPEEMRERLANRLKEMDKNSDGKISLEEYKASSRSPERAEARFKELDKDEDGFLTLEEFSAGMKSWGNRQRREGGGDARRGWGGGDRPERAPRGDAPRPGKTE